MMHCEDLKIKGLGCTCFILWIHHSTLNYTPHSSICFFKLIHRCDISSEDIHLSSMLDTLQVTCLPTTSLSCKMQKRLVVWRMIYQLSPWLSFAKTAGLLPTRLFITITGQAQWTACWGLFFLSGLMMRGFHSSWMPEELSTSTEASLACPTRSLIILNNAKIWLYNL